MRGSQGLGQQQTGRVSYQQGPFVAVRSHSGTQLRLGALPSEARKWDQPPPRLPSWQHDSLGFLEDKEGHEEPQEEVMNLLLV